MHHLCQGEWERRNLHPDVIARLCCLHHPNYKYTNAPGKNNSPTRSSFPPKEVFPTASPADSSITGAAAIATRAKRKRRTTKGATAGTGKKKKNPPGHTQQQMEAVKEGTADYANLSRKKPPESTQKMKKTPSSSSRVNDPRMFEEEKVDDSELGDMGDSDDEGAEADIHNEGVSLREVLESSNEPIGDDADNIDDLKGEEFSPAAEGNGVVQLVGAPDGWVPPGPPPTWAGYQPKGNAPQLGDVDNPGNWSLYSFCPKYKTGSVYSGHFTPAGAMVLPANEHGERELNGWRFHYQGWTPDTFDKSTYVRGEATQHDLKPDSRKGSLDANILRKHGCDADRVRDDPLFFYQLLFPFCPPESSGIEDDSRMPYHSHVAIFTNIYASISGGGSGMGHDWRNVTVPELVHWTGVPIRHGSLDGKPGTTFSRWNKHDPRYDSAIADVMTIERWKSIKRYFKLNNNLLTKPRGMEGYDPCAKYDYIYKCLVHNMNYLTLRADSDGTIDETTWGFGGYGGEAVGRLMNKKVTKGGQSTMFYDIHRRYPRAYIHRHKLQKRYEGFNAQGPSEVVDLVMSIDSLIVNGESTEREVTEIQNPTGNCFDKYRMKKIYETPPHIVADNHFSGDEVMDVLGRKGYGATMTNRRDRFPKGLKPFLHHDKVLAGCQKAKAFRYEMPIVAVKQQPAMGGSTKAYTRTLVSFQSTGATNICGVNNLPSVTNYISKKARGRGKTKRVWGIEQNEARETYLRHYYGIDNLDHMIKNTNNRYITWKYWHAPYLHAKSMGIIAAYDMYNECCDGLLDASWAIPKKRRMGFTEFRIKLSEQMLKYDPRDNRYAGDHKFRRFTQHHKLRRGIGSANSMGTNDDEVFSNDGLTFEVFKKARELPRFCTTLEQLNNHFRNVVKLNNAAKCEVCGEKTIWRCDICLKHLCTLNKRTWNGAKCLMTYHNENFYGLARSDYRTVHGKNVEGWTAPDDKAFERNARRVKRFMAEIMSEAS